MNSDTVELCRALVQRPSVTPLDAGCQQLLAERLQALGFTLEPMQFGDVSNLWARLGNTAPLLVFAGHTDVVPTGDEAHWSVPPFSASIVNGHIVGRGAADMKGSIAAMLTAAERFIARTKTLNGSFAFLITGDEEGPAVDGTARVVNALVDRREIIDYCLVGEPTSTTTLGDTIKHGRRGSLGARMRIRGVQGHVAYPHLADNPVHRTVPMLTELVAIEWDQGNQHFPPTTLQISNMQAGTGASNVIPGELIVDFNLRYNTETSVDTMQQRVQALVRKHALDAQLDWRMSAEPFLTDAGSLTDAMQTAIKAVTGIHAALETGGGTSDGRFIAPTGAQVLEFGPLNASIHQVDERVSCDDLDSLSSIYEHLLEQLLGDTRRAST